MDITRDFMKIYKNDNEKLIQLINIASDVDYILTISNKGREPIYIENFLCQILI
jgi:hypothetical protein